MEERDVGWVGKGKVSGFVCGGGGLREVGFSFYFIFIFRFR